MSFTDYLATHLVIRRCLIMIDTLCNQIWSRREFQNDFMFISTLSAKLCLEKDEAIINENLSKVFRVLQCALTFALSPNIEYRQRAYEIAVAVRNIIMGYKEKFDIEPEPIETAISLIFSRLGNFPAENKYIEETKISLHDELPSLLWFERENHLIDNTIKIAGEDNLFLTDFQLNLWRAISNRTVTIVNAPTSAGKSFVLQNHIIDLFVKGCARTVIYIVPTRALIEQVSKELKTICRRTGCLENKAIITEVPNIDSVGEYNIFVLTQERVQLLLDHNIDIDLVIVDEAQNVADSARGVILQSVIESIRETNENVKFIFATPYVKNPEVFLSTFHLSDLDYEIIPISEAPVSQNIYNIQIKTNDLTNISILKMDLLGNFYEICDVHSTIELSSEQKYLAIVPLLIGENQNNIVYSNEPSSCENIAALIAQEIATKDLLEDPELNEFSIFIKEHIHKDYLLAYTVKHGVVYHYGNLPSFIRKGIERLCSLGRIKYVVCTSTLLQGVNLPAQNIFIMKPEKGYDYNHSPIPMTAPDFWNLAGRAGRLTKDFEGNIFLINVHEWEQNPLLQEERRQLIQPSFAKYICDPNEKLCEFIEDQNHKSGQSSLQGLENTFMKLFLLNAEGRMLDALDAFGNKLSDLQRIRIVEAIQKALQITTLPYDVFSKNPNVSVFRQEELYSYLKKRIEEKDAHYLIPPHPMHAFDSISGDYVRLFKKLDKYLAKDNNRRHAYFSKLALLWMRGASYHDLLASRIEYKNQRRKRGSANVNTEARGLFDDIEFALRFKYVKFTKCYNDLLSYVLKERNMEQYKESIPPLHLFLELGASSGTMINLMGMGISRTAASQTIPHMINTSMKREDIVSWISHTNIYALGLPQSVISELEQLLP